MRDAVELGAAPAHLLLGAMALELARKDLAAKAAMFDKWESGTLGADYPEGVEGLSGNWWAASSPPYGVMADFMSVAAKSFPTNNRGAS